MKKNTYYQATKLPLQVPKGLKTQDAVLPLYQACLLGHKDTADLLMDSASTQLDQEKQVIFFVSTYIVEQAHIYSMVDCSQHWLPVQFQR